MHRLFAVFGLLACSTAPAADEAKGDFSTKTIDLGMAVANADRSVRFYTEAIGFKEVPGFEVAGDYAKDIGLTNGAPVKVRVLVLGDGDGATKLKLIEFPDSKPKKNDNEFVDKELGFRYLTLFVNDTNAALKRLEKAGVKPLGKGTQALPKGFPEGIFITVVKDPDGNVVELVGPKK